MSISAGSGRVSLLRDVLLPFLRRGQNEDGGWGYRSGHRSSVEPTCWAIAALGNSESSDRSKAAIESACRWLNQTQLPDGAWPSFAGQRTGSWVTALACLVLQEQRASRDRVAQGLRWLCKQRPAEGGLWWRIRQRASKRRSFVHQDSSLIGWSWTPATASWVEPTSYSLILLRNVPKKLYPQGAQDRKDLGERMLYDRICAGGGWNSGNPLVYGVTGEPRVIPTAWALLALKDHPDRAENRLSLDWLERTYQQIQGPGSLALAHLCLQVHNRPAPALETDATRLYERNQFFHDFLVTAWVSIALGPRPLWVDAPPR
jgi:Prenyltransferase and squalene oxidase repeat